MAVASFRRFAIPFCWILLSLLGLSYSDTTRAQAPNECVPDGWASVTRCMPVRVEPWRFEDNSGLPYGGYLPGTYKSTDAFRAALMSEFQNRGHCSVQVDPPSGPANAQTYVGLLWRQSWGFGITLGNALPCSPAFAGTAWAMQVRDIWCPLNFGLVSSAGSYVCACNTAECIIPRPCPKGSVRKGNPCDVLSGDKTQREVDYSAAGDSALNFVRTYFSGRRRIVREVSEVNPLGVNWMATYLQWLSYAKSGARAGLYAYRPDGGVLAFNETSTGFFIEGEVGTRVEWTYTSGVKSGFLLRTATDDVELYDLDGRLLSITSHSGVVQTLTYNALGYVASVIDSFGHTMQFTWQPGSPSRLTTVTLPGGGTITFAYGANNNLTSVTYPDLTQRQYHYELTDTGRVNLLTGITDENGARYATWGYDTSGRATSSEYAGGVDRYTFAYNSGGSRVVTDPLNTVRTYSTAISGGQRRYTGVNAPCNGCGEFASTVYDANGNVATRTDFNGVQTTFVYDLSRNLETSRTEAFGTPQARTITTAWHATFRSPTLITEANRTTDYAYDASGNVLTRTVTDTSVTPNVTRTWTYTYNGFGQLLTEDGPRTDVADVTTFTYYNCATGAECGRLQTVTNAAGQVTTYNTYNAHGQSLTLADPNGVVTTLTYDSRQRMISRQVGGETVGFTYWPNGLTKRVTLADGSFLQYTYDDAHRLTTLSDGEGNSLQYTLDAMGNRTGENAYDPTSVLSRTRTRVFNSLNQLWKQVGAAGTAAVTTEYQYDDNGNLTDVHAPLARNSMSQYDELDRLKQITDPSLGNTIFGYDADDNLISVQDPRNLTTTYAYTGFGDLRTQSSPDTGVTTNTYDTGGNLQTSTDARNTVTTLTYDALNRVTTAAFAAGATTDQTITYTYDAGTNGIGRLTGATDSLHSIAWQYDALGRVVDKSQTVGGVTKSVGYGYSNGLLTSMTTPSGQAVVYGYSNNRVTSIAVNGTTVLSNVLYEPFGPTRGWTWGNGTFAIRTSDTDGNLTQIDSAGFYSYGYDDASRVTSFTDSSIAANSWTYGYDASDRLVSAVSGGTTQGFTYDANGNRLAQTGSSASTFTVSPTGNRLSATSGALGRAYAYDAAGSTLAYGGITNTYNNRGRMVTSTVGSATTTYVYDALGQRIRKSGGIAGIVIFAYDEAGHLVGEYDDTGTLLQETVWMGDIPVATLRPTTGGIDIFYVHTDNLGTPRRVTRPSDNKLRWKWDSDPFGTNSPNEDPDAVGAFTYGLRFAGQYFDAESGLNYNYFRDYDPATGRYIQSDPIGLAASLNTYSYVDADPIGYVDPWGLARCTYSISKHTVNCTSNDGTVQRGLGPDGVWSGVRECTNNPAKACQESSDYGPVPEGKYKMNRDARAGHGGFWRLEPTPKKSGLRYLLGLDRAGFMLHPGSVSLGCITADKDNTNLMNQYSDLNKLLLKEDGSNLLTVVP